MMDRTKYAIPDIQEPEPVVCLRCGAWVVRQSVHTEWHKAQEELRAVVQELNPGAAL